MFSRLQAFISRHRRKFIFGSVAISGAYYLSRYVQQILKERQERETNELLERSRKQQHYESIERLCNEMTLSVLQALKGRLVELINAEKLVEDLTHGVGNKFEVWEELKVLSFTKAMLLIYAGSLIMVFLRIQFSIIGGCAYRRTLNLPRAKKVSNNVQDTFMQLSESFLKHGLESLRTMIEEKVRLIVKTKALQTKMTVFDVERLLYSIQSSIAVNKHDPCLIPDVYILGGFSWMDHALIPEDIPAMMSIMNEMRDILRSSDVQSVLKTCVSYGLVCLVNQLKSFFLAKVSTPPSKGRKRQKSGQMASTSSQSDALAVSVAEPGEMDASLTNISIPLAKIIPIVNGLVLNQNSKNDVSQMWLKTSKLNVALTTLGANVYEAFSSS